MRTSGRICENGIFAKSSGQNASTIIEGHRATGEDGPDDITDVEGRFPGLFGRHIVVELHYRCEVCCDRKFPFGGDERRSDTKNCLCKVLARRCNAWRRELRREPLPSPTWGLAIATHSGQHIKAESISELRSIVGSAPCDCARILKVS
jgi:hypothetical protein